MPRLDQIGDGIWTLNQSLNALGLDLRRTMTIIKLPDNTLALHGPIALDESTLSAIHKLGEVTKIIAPSAFHYRAALTCLQHFPDALVLYAESLNQGIPQALQYVHRKQALNTESFADLSPTLEALPLLGIPFLNEVLFYHPSSRSLISGNVFTFVPKASGLLSAIFCWLFKITRGQLQYSALLRLCLRDREQFSQSVDKIKGWSIDHFILSQGPWKNTRELVDLMPLPL